MSGPEFCSKLICRIDGWIDFSPEPFLRSLQGLNYVLKGRISDYKQVDITGGTEFAAGCRTKDQSRKHAPAERSGLDRHDRINILVRGLLR